jgi:type 1 glutamine amidotransferase
MTTVNDNQRPQVLVVSGGHPYAEEPFVEMFEADAGVDCTYSRPPEVRAWFHPDRVGTWDAIVCYDMQGFEFRKPELPNLLTPPADYAEGFQQMLERGQGIVFLHHAMSAWPTWPLWAKVVGGRWNYVPGELEGRQWPASGYTREVEHHVECLEPTHPVCAGLEDGFDIVDEIYLNPVLDHTFTPLFKSTYPMTSEHFFSGELAMRDRLYDNEGWSHPEGLGYMAWVKTAGTSPVVYLQGGHGPSAYANPSYRRLLGNAIRWVASPEAHAWARDHATSLVG